MEKSPWERLATTIGPQEAAYVRDWRRFTRAQADYTRDLRRKAASIGQTEIPEGATMNDTTPREPTPIYQDQGRQRLKAIQRAGPLGLNDEMIGYTCFACLEKFAVGDYLTLVKLGPGNDPRKQAAERAKTDYEAVFLSVHFACGTGITDEMYDDVTVAKGERR